MKKSDSNFFNSDEDINYEIESNQNVPTPLSKPNLNSLNNSFLNNNNNSNNNLIYINTNNSNNNNNNNYFNNFSSKTSSLKNSLSSKDNYLNQLEKKNPNSSKTFE